MYSVFHYSSANLHLMLRCSSLSSLSSSWQFESGLFFPWPSFSFFPTHFRFGQFQTKWIHSLLHLPDWICFHVEIRFIMCIMNANDLNCVQLYAVPLCIMRFCDWNLFFLFNSVIWKFWIQNSFLFIWI